MSNLFETAIVEKRNVLNELRSNNMTLQELRFFSIYLSKINPWDKSTRSVRFPIDDFKKIMGFGRLNMSQLKASTDSLLCKVVHVPDDRGGYTAFTLFKRCRVSQNDDNEWFMEIDASDDALPLMFDFKNRYFKYELWNALQLKSPNQIRMYELLKQYEGLGNRELSIVDLRALLGIADNEYSGRTGWSDFRKYVLDSCQQALKQYTDICYTYERGKTGKGGKWLTIIFYITKNEGHVDQLSLDEFIDMQSISDTLANDPLSGQTSLFDDEFSSVDSYEYEDDRLGFLACGCKNEFSEVEMEHIFRLIADKQLPPHSMGGIDFAREDYLSKMYSKFEVYADRNNIKKENRYGYFCKMLENDTEL